MDSEQSNMWTLENTDARLVIDQQTGWLSSLTLNRPQLDILDLPGQAKGAGVNVYDEAKGICHSDLTTPSVVSEAQHHGNVLQFVKRFSDADFDIRMRLRLDGNCLHWTVGLRNREPLAREMRVNFLLPLPMGWQLWAPASGTPLPLEPGTAFDYAYLPGPHDAGVEICIPILSVYDQECGLGMTVSEELDRRFPGVHYSRPSSSLPDEQATGHYLEISHPNLALRGDSLLETSILLHFHEGDWRPGLGWLYGKYREFFDPGLSKIHEQVGTFLCGNIRLEDSWETYITGKHPTNEMDTRMKRLKQISLRFMEVHDHFPFYGLYAPEAESWENIANLEHPDSEIGFTITYQAVRDFMRYLHHHGVVANIYFQFSQCYDRYAEEKFPESIARDKNGDPIPVGWPYLYVMNPDVELPWATHCLEQVDRLLEAYPEVDGLFLDCFRHCDLDFGHDDGTTMVDNKPCYNVNFAYDGITGIITEKLRSRSMVNLANKPATIQQTKGIDCVLLEGRGKAELVRQFFLCISRPMIYMWMNGRPMAGRSEEEYLKHCLLYGAFPQVSYYHNTATEAEWNSIAEMYQCYLPLIEQLRGRRLAFDPDPLHAPPGVEGQVFINPNEDYVVSIVSPERSINDELDAHRKLEISITPTLPVQEVLLMLPGDRQPTRTSFSREKGAIRVPILHYRCAAVIELRTDAPSSVNRGTAG